MYMYIYVYIKTMRMHVFMYHLMFGRTIDSPYSLQRYPGTWQVDCRTDELGGLSGMEMQCTARHGLGFLSGTISGQPHKVFSGPACATDNLRMPHAHSLLSVLFHHANTCRRVIRLLEMPIERCSPGAHIPRSGRTGQE